VGKTTSRKWGGVCVLVFLGLPFAGIGLYLSMMGWGMWSLYYQSSGWIRIPAVVTQADFQTHYSSKGGRSYSVQCRYTYVVGGKNYSGTRVGLENHGGSSDSYHRRRYDVLVRHRDGRNPLDVLVNPVNPKESIIFRELTPTMYALPMCGLLFGLPGLAVIVFGLGSYFKTRRKEELLARNPERPWRAESNGQGFEIQGNPLKKVVASLATAFFMGIFVSIFWITMGADKTVPIFVKVIIGLITLIPAGCLVAAFYQLCQYSKYGNPKQVLRQMPLVLGQENAALLYVRTYIAAEKGIELSLQCIKRESVNHGGKSSVEDREIYGERKTVTEDMAERTGRGSAIPVRFAIPSGQPETFSGDLPNYIWRIVAKAATPGVDFSAEFEVPVYNVTNTRLIETNPMIKN
jgi:hypothetical protein